MRYKNVKSRGEAKRFGGKKVIGCQAEAAEEAITEDVRTGDKVMKVEDVFEINNSKQ